MKRFIAILIAFSFVQLHAQRQEMQDEISYSNDIRPVIQNFCTTCHAGDDPDGDFTLTSYKDVRYHVEKGELLETHQRPRRSYARTWLNAKIHPSDSSNSGPTGASSIKVQSKRKVL